MLTLPAEPRPQTGLMDSLPAVAPSFVRCGVSGSRRSPRKNHVTERRAAQKPYGKPTSPTRKPRPSPPTAQVELSVPSRPETKTGKETQQEKLNFSVATETVHETLHRPPISPRASSLNRTVPSGAVTSNPKGWVIGPLFQSFRTKMASFTEIVFSPVKLFKSDSTESEAPANEPTAAANTDGSLCTSAEDRVGSVEKGDRLTANELTDLQNSEEDILKAEVDRVVPWRTPETELEAFVTQSASDTANATTEDVTVATACKDVGAAEEEVRWSTRTRMRQNKTTPQTKTEVRADHQNMDCDFIFTKTDSEIGRESDGVFENHLNENQTDQTPTSRSILDDVGLKKVKRTLNLSEETGKRKKMSAKTEEERAESALKRKPTRKEETADAVTKAVTRATKKSQVEQGANLTVNNQSSLVILNGDDQKSVKTKDRTVKKVKSSDLQTSKVESPEALTAPLPETISSKKRKTRDEARAEESRASGVTGKAERKTKKTKTAAKGRNATEKLYFEMTAPPENDGCDIAAAQSLQGEGGVGELVEGGVGELVEGGVVEGGVGEVVEGGVGEVVEGGVGDLMEGGVGEVVEGGVGEIVEGGVGEVVEGGVGKRRTRRTDTQRRKCRLFKSRKGDEAVAAAATDDAMFKRGSSTRLLRSQSCPEIPWLRPLDTPWTPHFHSPPRSHSQPPQQQHAAPLSLSSSSSSLAQHFRRSPRRARRHTVCSLEVEREIAPLCLAKEVYPARRSPSPYDPQHLSLMRALSPGASLSALASGFLSSPLAFLSKRSEGSPLRSLSPAPSTLRSLSPAAASSATSLSSLLGTSLGQLPGFHLRTDTLLDAASDANISVSLLVCPPEASPPEEDEDTSSSPESEELREETALSDSEIKVVKKAEGHRKVSSIKIRKALPKPQNNLTPMGLPRAVRVKKKEFSLEEIYTNKNFSKPPESRLETIFEAPLSRKNGAEAWCGQKRVKRFLEFPALGESRRPKKPLVGAAKANAANSRKRRGNREDPALVSDPDSLLCAKLEQLASWLAHDYS